MARIFCYWRQPGGGESLWCECATEFDHDLCIVGVFYAFGGMLEAGRIGSATNNLGFMYELDAIAACVVGGVSFSGGVGTVIGVVTGVIIFTVINYGLTYIGVNPYWQYIIKGGIIIFAVALDSLKYAKKK